jgi:hypothetical protein
MLQAILGKIIAYTPEAMELDTGPPLMGCSVAWSSLRAVVQSPAAKGAISTALELRQAARYFGLRVCS